MIVVQTPLRISLFGGGTDFPSFFQEEDGCVLSSAIDKFIFITAKRRFDQKLRVGYTKTEMVDHVDEIRHELIREALRKTQICEGVEITTMGDIPSAGSGLGSSSTVTVGALHALYTYLGSNVPADRLAREACQIELEELKKPIGIQDQYIAAFGGLRFMEFRSDGNIAIERILLSDDLRQRLDERLLLFFTGITRKSSSILEEQRANIRDRIAILREMKSLAYQARDMLRSENLDDFGRLLHENWQLKKQMASRISNGEIDDLYLRAIKAGALGGKITGAGGGGFLLLYCPKESQDNLRREFHSLQELPFQLERDGSKVIFNYRRSYDGAPFTERDDRSVLPIQTNVDGLNASELASPPARPEPSSLGPVEREPSGYFQGAQDLLSRIPEEPIQQLIQILHEARTNHRQAIIMGNGGSASTASHFACDLSKNTRCAGWPDFRATSLGDNLAILTAYANDEGYENVFLKQLASLILPDDVVIAISASGNSENVLRAIRHAKEARATTIGLTGFDGGVLKSLVDVHIHVPSDCIEYVEDVHLMIEHMVTKSLRERAQAYTQQGPPESAVADKLVRRVPMVEASGKSTSAVPEYHTDLEKTDPIDVLFRINQLLISHIDIKLTLREVLRVVTEGLGAASGSVLILDESGELTDGEVSYDGAMSSRAPEELRDIFSQGLASWVIQNRQGALVEDTREDSRWVQRAWEQDRDPPRSAISVPLMIDDKPRAVLTLANPELKRFSKGDLDILSAIALCIMMKVFASE